MFVQICLNFSENPPYSGPIQRARGDVGLRRRAPLAERFECLAAAAGESRGGDARSAAVRPISSGTQSEIGWLPAHPKKRVGLQKSD